MDARPERLEIAPAEHAGRSEALRGALERAGFDAMCVFGPARVSYLSGFHFAATERPVAMIVPVAGESAMLIPQLERDHLRRESPQLGRVRSYPEYPGGGSGKHPMAHLAAYLAELGLAGARLCADHDGYENRWGYRGPSLSEVLGVPVAMRLELVDDLRIVKSAAETALIEEACRWGDRAHEILQGLVTAGASELEVSQAATLAATREMLAALGPRYVPKSREGNPANAMFIRGANTANPHGLHQAQGVVPGDVLVTGAFAIVGGYESELERTMFFGAPDERFVRYFEAMEAVQQVGFDAIRPGRSGADVERAVFDFVHEELGLGACWRHHTGHSFGLEGHEHPFLDLDDPTPLQAGMILSVEPGLYVPGYAGFRHSDTVLVTEDGCRRLSRYPRGLEALVIGG